MSSARCSSSVRVKVTLVFPRWRRYCAVIRTWERLPPKARRLFSVGLSSMVITPVQQGLAHRAVTAVVPPDGALVASIHDHDYIDTKELLSIGAAGRRA